MDEFHSASFFLGMLMGAGCVIVGLLSGVWASRL